jgi:hypothetical protein
VFGLLMAGAAAVPAHGPALLAAVLAGVCVLGGVFLRPLATTAVLAAGTALALAEPSGLFAALSGLSATAYLVIRYAVGMPDLVTTTRPTMVGAFGFTAAGLVAVATPVALPWLPLLAPPAAAGVYLLALRPFIGSRWHTPHSGQL